MLAKRQANPLLSLQHITSTDASKWKIKHVTYERDQKKERKEWGDGRDWGWSWNAASISDVASHIAQIHSAFNQAAADMSLETEHHSKIDI